MTKFMTILIQNSLETIFRNVNTIKKFEVIDEFDIEKEDIDYDNKKEIFAIFGFYIEIEDDEITKSEDYNDDNTISDKLIMILEEEKAIFLILNDDEIIKHYEVEDIYNYI